MTRKNMIKSAWGFALVLLFVVFSIWYGGNGKPLSASEGADLLDRFHQAYGDPETSYGFAANISEMITRDDGKEFYAVNLENHKEGDAAKQADAAYAKIVMPLLFKRASHPVFVSERVGLMLGEYGNQVDRVAVVRYRSLKDMIEMTLEPSMKAGENYKFAALDHTEVFVTRPTISFMHVRLLLALVLIVIGGIGFRLIDWLS